MSSKPVAQPASSTRPRWRDRLDTRFVLLTLALLVGVQAMSLYFTRRAIEANARQSISAELGSAERVFHRLVDQRADRLIESARILATDYGFRDAISSDDEATIGDALANHTARIGAQYALFADTSLRLKGANDVAARVLLPWLEGRDGSGQRDDARTVVLEGHANLLVTVPVRAPLTIGWVMMSFPIDDTLLQDLFRLTTVRASVLVRSEPGARWRVDRTTQPALRDAPFLRTLALRAGEGPAHVDAAIDGALNRVAFHRLEGSADAGTALILTRSIDEALAPYDDLRLRLLGLTLLGAVLFAVGSFASARRVTRPLQSLSGSIAKLKAGDYETPIEVRDRSEVGSLARSFESMRSAVLERDRRISRLAYVDELTGLPNRAGFVAALEAAVARCASIAVLILDLDRFKKVNEVLGQPTGDRLLAAFARRLAQDGAAPGTLIARFGGDEFAILLEHAGEAHARALAERIRRLLETPMQLDEQTIDVGAGIGIALHPEHGADAAALLAAAEVAMYEAKRRHSTVQFYAPSIDARAGTSLSTLSEVRRAIDDDQLELWLQPKVSFATGQVVAAEALVRWRHPERGLVPPMQFVPFLEETGSIHLLSAWVLRQAMHASHRLRGAGLSLRIAVNLSARDLMDADLPSKVEALLEGARLPASTLCIEITESAMMDDPDRALATLERLDRLGIALSIDDFGTGYSSLAYLKRLPVSQLKIDRSFVMNMARSTADAQIVRSTIELAHNLGLEVVAEGIETAHEWDMLRAFACDEAQGYLIAKPQPLEAFVEWARRHAGLVATVP